MAETGAPAPNNPNQPPLVHAVFAGSVGGVFATLVGHPFETVKVRLQTGMTDNLFRNVYAGVASPLVGVTPVWALGYVGYKGARNLLPADTGPVTGGAVAGASSGIVATILKTPVEAIKVVAQNNRSSSITAGRLLFAEQGFRGFYRGNTATFIHLAGSQALFYAVYEVVQRQLGDAGLELAPRSFLAGGIAGLFEWTGFMPTDVLKTRCQAKPGVRLSVVAKEIYAIEGLRGFYRGYLPTILRAFPANGAGFMGIELANAVLKRGFSDE